MTAPDLLPCPFCGHHPHMWGDTSGEYQIECVNGNCPSEPSVWMPEKDEAIAAWNTRATPAATDPKVKALVEAATSLVSTIGDDPDLMGKEQIVSMLNDTAAAIRSVRAALREGGEG